MRLWVVRSSGSGGLGVAWHQHLTQAFSTIENQTPVPITLIR
jgi:hypothetical protein